MDKLMRLLTRAWMDNIRKPIMKDYLVLDTLTEEDKVVIIQGLNFAQQLCYGQSVKTGWWSDLETGQPLERNKGEMFGLMHSEISEAMEGARKNLMDKHLPHRPTEEVELADAIIRIMDYAGGHGLDVAGALMEKLEYNAVRADHKIENRIKDHGKKF